MTIEGEQSFSALYFLLFDILFLSSFSSLVLLSVIVDTVVLTWAKWWTLDSPYYSSSRVLEIHEISRRKRGAGSGRETFSSGER